ncbi:NADP(H)-dependent aldo-keto reductase [Salinisphaera sp. Q1T1-3]|uniref:NADP(H)-dependent aldo-keto reductase n=1 Tax=Salinisphaera sp. Q1T1-3 TaxID=2321229 RepID=UPI000E739CFC|nr:NADP(H)-dependent aldo-keto reductase [Salinisphaera sp. Q1T1-3]RJS91218.1 NADP(H)-dependent aldo-keto reductase [Salinisphaera sp. Q1T1-3]
MEYRKLGQTDIDVSALCLGTMTFGEQNSEAEAHAQLDYAVSRGINFIDAAEMYPVPPQAETQGRTEAYIGSWLAARGKRDDVVLATKVTGRARTPMTYLRDGETPRLTPAQIRSALEASLSRLRTDHVDLYQLHWPDRFTNFFGQLGYTHDAHESPVAIEDTLGELGRLVDEGKIRHVGLSNETPWGVMRFLAAAETAGLPRVASIQNPYSLLNRSFEIGLSEVAIREQVGLLAYSPLAFGMLSGKYENGARPAGARLTRWDRFARYNGERGRDATAAYVALAREHGLDPAQMALAFVTSRDFVTSNIVGATTMDQLRTNIDSADLVLSEALRTELETIHAANPNPCP